MTLPIILNLVLIQFIIVNIIDVSSLIYELEKMIGKYLSIKNVKIPKPFSCSYCMNFWVSIIYLLCIGNLTLPYIAVVLTLSALTEITREAVNFIKDLFTTIFNLLNKVIMKLQ